MQTIIYINFALAVLFFICYLYQVVYIPVSWFKKPAPHKETKMHRYAFLISARNEGVVIGQLVDSIRNQTYDSRLITVFVIADNCTDDTAARALRAGAVVYERENAEKVGKGYALDELLSHIRRDYGPDAFDGFFVFDADNVLDSHYVEEMNKTFSDGYQAITSYRNAKNFGDNWIASGYAMLFLREARYLNQARMLLGKSCAVSGTGFLFSKEVLKRNGGWPFYLLTEDIEFSVQCVLQDIRIGYCDKAIFYDEQPTAFSQSFRQRLRWSRGFLQVFRHYGAPLIKKMLSGSFSAFDMTMATMPAMVLSIVGLLLDISLAVGGLIIGNYQAAMVGALMLGQFLLSTYITLFLVGAITMFTEKGRIHATRKQKIAAVFTYPLFSLTSFPISLASLFRRVEWTPIAHTCARTLQEICEDTKK